MYELDDVVFAVFIGFIPTASMLFASFALYNFAVSSLIEASCQNFTSGLIIAAVAQELFPLMNPPKRDPNAVNLESGLPLDAQYFIGTTLGFVMGVAMINGVAQIIEVLENAGDGGTNLQGYFSELLSSFKEKAMENWRKMKMIFSGPGGYDDIPDGSSQRRKNSIFIAGQLSPEMQAQLTATYKSMSNPSSPAPADLESNSSPPPSTEDNVRESKLDDDDDDGETSSYDRAAVRTAAAAIASPQHRNRIKTIFLEIMTSVDSLEKMSMHLAHDRNGVLALLERESREELIDQEVHQLQYRLDHARRLLQGSESDLSASPKSSRPRVSPNSSQKWVEKRDRIEEILTALKTMAFHLLEHLEPGAEIGIPVLRELHEHVEEMDSNIAELHKTTEDASFKWRKLAKLVIPAKGSFVPPSLILPVIIDGFVDGFLIGVACSLSRSAGRPFSTLLCFFSSYWRFCFVFPFPGFCRVEFSLMMGLIVFCTTVPLYHFTTVPLYHCTMWWCYCLSKPSNDSLPAAHPISCSPRI